MILGDVLCAEPNACYVTPLFASFLTCPIWRGSSHNLLGLLASHCQRLQRLNLMQTQGMILGPSLMSSYRQWADPLTKPTTIEFFYFSMWYSSFSELSSWSMDIAAPQPSLSAIQANLKIPRSQIIIIIIILHTFWSFRVLHIHHYLNYPVRGISLECPPLHL